jgi:hypothetical protein
MHRAFRLFEIIKVLRGSSRPVAVADFAFELERSKRSICRDGAALIGLPRRLTAQLVACRRAASSSRMRALAGLPVRRHALFVKSLGPNLSNGRHVRSYYIYAYAGCAD